MVLIPRNKSRIFELANLDYSHLLMRGLSGWWLMNEGSGRTLFDINKNNNCAISGATWDVGQFGSALSLDGIDDYVDAGNSASLSPTKMSCALYINPSEYPIGPQYTAYKDVLRKENSYHFVLIGNNDPVGASSLQVGIKTGIYSENWYNIFIPNSYIPLNKWTHIILTADGSNLRAYVNGVQYGSDVSYSGSIYNTAENHLFLGTYGTTTPSLSRYFKGMLDDVRIYNRALSKGEVQIFYINPFSMFLSPIDFPSSAFTPISLSVSDLISTPALDSIALSQNHVLAVTDSIAQAVMGPIALSQTHQLSVPDLSSAASLSNVTILQTHILAIADVVATAVMESVAIGAGAVHQLVVEDLVATAFMDPVVLSQTVQLAVEDLMARANLESVGTSQPHILAVADLLSRAVVDSIALRGKGLGDVARTRLVDITPYRNFRSLN